MRVFKPGGPFLGVPIRRTILCWGFPPIMESAIWARLGVEGLNFLETWQGRIYGACKRITRVSTRDSKSLRLEKPGMVAVDLLGLFIIGCAFPTEPMGIVWWDWWIVDGLGLGVLVENGIVSWGRCKEIPKS